MKYWYSLFNTFSSPSMFKTNNRPDTFSGTFVIVSVLSSETTKYFPTVSKELKSVPSGIFPLFGNKLLLLLHRKNQVLFMIPGSPYSYCFFCFFFAALFQFVQSSPVYNAFPFTLSCLRTFWISSLPFLSAAIHKGL